MLSLRDIQTRFAEHIFDPNHDELSAAIIAGDLTASQRLSVYRNNMLVGLTKVLQSIYPVVERLVGEPFFRFAANRYIHLYPSRSGDLHDYGGQFSEFLQTFEAAAELTYLPDVAALEYARHSSASAADSALMDLTALAQVAAEDYEALKFGLAPSARLLSSNYPILRIWQVNQEAYTGDDSVDLRAGGEQILIIRRDLQVEIQRLQAAEFALLMALADNRSFADACEQAHNIEPGFDVAAGFQKHVAQGTLVDFSV